MTNEQNQGRGQKRGERDGTRQETRSLRISPATAARLAKPGRPQRTVAGSQQDKRAEENPTGKQSAWPGL